MFSPMFETKKLAAAAITAFTMFGSLSASADPWRVPPGQAGRPQPAYGRSAPAYGGGPGAPVVIGPAPGYNGGSTTVVVRPGRVPPGGRVGGAPPGWGYGRDGRIVVRPPVNGAAHDQAIANMFMRHTQGLSCENLGELLRRISNELLEARGTSDDDDYRWENQHPDQAHRAEWVRRHQLADLRHFMKRPEFFQLVMARLTEAFRGCDRSCFDDGVAIGIISGTGYCNAAIGVSGLPDPGFQAQQRLPLCQTENFVGCQSGYTQAVNQVQGCLGFATGAYYEGFEHQVSQDCHID